MKSKTLWQIGDRMMRRVATRRLRPYFETGERVLATEITRNDSVFTVTNRALYIKPDFGQRSKQAVENRRIPLEHVVTADEVTQGIPRRRIIRCFPRIGGFQTVDILNADYPLTRLLRLQIEELVQDRLTLQYRDCTVRFVLRQTEPGAASGWHLEDFDPALEPPSEDLQAWVSTTLSNLNNRR